MYAYNDNGTLRLMGALPVRLRLADGLTRTALDELDSKQLAELGIYPVKEDKPVISTATQVYGEPKLYLDGETVIAVYPVIEKTKEQILAELAGAREAKLAELAEARWLAETGGLTLPNGMRVNTDDRSKTLLAGAVQIAKDFPENLIEWKGEPWLDLDAKTILYVGGMVAEFIQACFSKERVLSEKVLSCNTIEEVNNINWG